MDGSPYLDSPVRSKHAVMATRLVFDISRYGKSITLNVETHDGYTVADIKIDMPDDGRAEFKADWWPEMKPHYFWAIHRRVKHIIRDAHFNGIRRVWCVVRDHDDKGNRWLCLLGFKPEGLLRAYFPDGRNGIMYAHVAAEKRIQSPDGMREAA